VEKIQLNNTHAYSDFIREDEQLFLLDWINNNTNATNRLILPPKNIPNAPLEIIENYKSKIVQLENLKNFLLKPKSGDFVWIETKNSAITYHLDQNFEQYVHTRYNLILSYPNEGGHSIYGDKMNVLQERMLWKCVAGKVKHGATKVVGDKSRITLSFSFFIDEKEIIQDYEKVKNFETLPDEIKRLT
jgi:hypothetical protein